jgi:WD40 repeat protein
MTPPTACIEPPRLRALLDGALPEQEQADLLGHLETCHRCQQTLEQLVADQGSWSSLPRYLRPEPAAPEPAAPPPMDNDPPLAFLRPSDRPGSLGRLGHYEVSGVIGRGGVGIVLKGLDPRLQRVVAIKVLAPHLAASAAARARFVREAQAAAAVRDEHVVAIHGVDEANGVHYLVMEYIAGVSLQERLDRTGPLRLREVLRIGMQAAAGLAAAHAQGLVHRDLKPANILLEEGRDRVKLTDFGLARAADDAGVSANEAAGTPAYLAPEQARGEAVDHRADLFSLGSVLYALCTGRPPFRAGGALAVLKRVCEDTPRPVREVNPEVPDWLAAVIARLHARDPAQRFASAAEVAALLDAHLARLPQAAPVSLPPATAPPRRGWRRGAWVAAGLVLLGCLALAEATGTTRLVATLRRSPHVVPDNPEKGRPPPAAPSPLDRLDPAAIPAAERFDGQPKELVAVLGEHRGRCWQVIRSLACSPDGKLVAAAGLDNPIVLFDADTLRPRGFLRGQSGKVFSVAFAPDSRRLLAGAADGTVSLWDVATGTERLRFQKPGEVFCVRFSPDGRRALSAGHDRAMHLWDVDTGRELKRLEGDTFYVAALAFSADGGRAVSGHSDQTARVWDLQAGKELGRFKGRPGVVAGLAFLPGGRQVLSAHLYQLRDGHALPAPDYDLRLWDAETGQEVRRLAGHQSPVFGLDLSADGRRAVTASQDRSVRFWDVEAGRELRCLEGHPGKVFTAALAPDGRRAFSGGEDNVVRQWDVDAGQELAPPTGHRGGVCNLAFSPDGCYLLSGGHEDRAVRLWDVVRGKELAPFEGHTAGVWCVAFSPDGRLALSGSGDKTLRVWDVRSRNELHKCEGQTGWFTSLAVSPDGRRALTANWFYTEKTVRCWDLDDGQEVPSLSLAGDARTVAFSPDGRQALTGGADKTVRLWDIDRRQVLRGFEGHTDLVTGVAFAPGGRRAASCAMDGTVWLWSLTTPEQPAAQLRGHTGSVSGVAFAPDGKTLASCDGDGRVILWDGRSGERLREWRLPGCVNAVAFAPDSRHLAVGNGNGTIYILRLMSAAEKTPVQGG